MIKDGIKGLGNCERIYCASDRSKIRICMVVKKVEAILLIEFSSRDLTVVLLEFEKVSGEVMDLTMRSVIYIL